MISIDLQKKSYSANLKFLLQEKRKENNALKPSIRKKADKFLKIMFENKELQSEYAEYTFNCKEMVHPEDLMESGSVSIELYSNVKNSSLNGDPVTMETYEENACFVVIVEKGGSAKKEQYFHFNGYGYSQALKVYKNCIDNFTFNEDDTLEKSIRKKAHKFFKKMVQNKDVFSDFFDYTFKYHEMTNHTDIMKSGSINLELYSNVEDVGDETPLTTEIYRQNANFRVVIEKEGWIKNESYFSFNGYGYRQALIKYQESIAGFKF